MIHYQKNPKSKPIQFFILSTLITSSLSNAVAVPMIVEDPIANATAATTASRMLDSINKATQALEKYDKMIKKAQESIDKINAVNDSINEVSNLIETSTMGIANPMDIINQINDMPDRVKRNADKLVKTIKDFNIRDHWQWKKIEAVCPQLEIDKIAPDDKTLTYSNVGKESEALKTFKALGKALNSNIISNSLSLAGELKGRAMALEACMLFTKAQQQQKEHEFEMQLKECILKRDKECYKKTKREWVQSEIDYRKNTRFLKAQQTDPLINRSKQMLEALGTLDKSFNDKEKKREYCKLSKKENGEEFCYPLFYDTKRLNDNFNDLQEELLKKLRQAGSDKKKQAQAYADVKIKTDMLLLEYTKDIANNLSFMNETISLIGNLVSRDYKHKYGNDDYFSFKEQIEKKVNEINQNFQSQTMNYKSFKDYNANLDKYGFPIISFTSSKKI
ncbi:hypothetical protein [Helicobacter sp. 11S03491-1]|uniref:hypothetical protein n=1 Tax=Helicobacter sp. 11S03491-1 TaxID=1476196 RepID=UPI000BA608B6|nr:hypothetical protein [Helicobacter sp. 11S03491-1]PAF41058.1 hypothetical protein BKH45_08420 [Helicobacter sp. 11S03491-1]